MVRRMISVPLVVISVALMLPGREVSAKEIKILVDTLASNFLAQQVSTICSVDNTSFRSETSGALGDAGKYAERVKQEVIAGLSSEEASALIFEAATKARGDALQLMTRFSANGLVDPVKLEGWCRTIGKALIRRLALTYDEHHSEFEQELNKAKR
jgi:hypothetical protein